MGFGSGLGAVRRQGHLRMSAKFYCDDGLLLSHLIPSLSQGGCDGGCAP